jgi:exodeoxyribonuclease V alpha subunit
MTELLVAVPPEVSMLDPFVRAGVFGPSEVQLAATIVRLSPSVSDEVILAIALAARGPRLGHECIELADAADVVVGAGEESPGDLPWPRFEDWSDALATSAVVARPETSDHDPFRPLVWDGRRLYLQRYWEYEIAVADDLCRRGVATSALINDGPELEAVLTSVFGPEDDATDLQRVAVRRALTHRISVIAGGPGTGKTWTIAAVVAAARQLDPRERPLQIALAAPTGKAATRMTEAVENEIATMTARGDRSPPGEIPVATTLHRLLGSTSGTAFRHDRLNPLPHDMVIVDETSMVSLPLMARLLDALRPTAQLVLVGDPFQLASIEAGSVLSDLVGPEAASIPDGAKSPLAGRVTSLLRKRRFAEESAIAALADAIRQGNVARALEILESNVPSVTWIQPDQAEELAELRSALSVLGAEVVGAADAGDAERAMSAASSVKVLCATRYGPFGMYAWSDQIEADVAELAPELNRYAKWYVGRPIMITANDPINKVMNGDVGLVVRDGESIAVAIPTGAEFRRLPPSRLDRVESWWAMTIHKSQGSEYPHAVLSLPMAPSPVLTRELLYTGVTRAKDQVTIVANELAVRSAISRPIARASGLRDRLWPAHS